MVVVVVVVVVAAAVGAAVRAGTLVTACDFPEVVLSLLMFPEVALSRSILLALLLDVVSLLEPINTRPEGSRVGNDPKPEKLSVDLSKWLLPLLILLLVVWAGAGVFSMKKEIWFRAFSRLFARAGGRLLLALLRAGGRLDDDA